MKKNDFQVKVKRELSKAKKVLYVEELISALFAAGFAGSLCGIFMLKFSLLTLFFVWCAWYTAKKFKPTIKKQEHLHGYIKYLKESMKEKVWTKEDAA